MANSSYLPTVTPAISKAYIFIGFLVVLIASQYYPFSNIDTVHYLNGTVRLLHGQDSMNGIVSPLLSWAVCLFAWFDISLINALRIVQCLAYLSILLATSRMLSRFILDEHLRGWAVIFAGVFLSPFILTEATGDVVAAAFFVWIPNIMMCRDWAGNVKAVLLVALLVVFSFYGKVVLLPISISILIVHSMVDVLTSSAVWRNRIFALIAISLIVAIGIAPYLVLFHEKYGVWNIGLNFYYNKEILDWDAYTMDQPIKEILETWFRTNQFQQEHGLMSIIQHLAGLLPNIPQTIIQSYRYLSSEVAVRSGGAHAAILFCISALIGAWRLFRRQDTKIEMKMLTVILVCFWIIYSALWGGRVRYFLPIIPIIVVCAWTALEDARLPQKLAKLVIPVFFVLSAAVASYQIANYRYNDIDRSVVTYVAENEWLRDIPGAVIANKENLTAGVVSALLRKELRGWLLADRQRTFQEIKKILASRKIGILVWRNTDIPMIVEDPNVVRVGHVKTAENTTFIYNTSGLWSNTSSLTE